MDITYYFIGLLTGVSVSTFVIGKELYKYYTKYTIQQKQLNRILKLNDKVPKLKKAESIKPRKLTTVDTHNDIYLNV
jgi:hypothetical protein